MYAPLGVCQGNRRHAMSSEFVSNSPWGLLGAVLLGVVLRLVAQYVTGMLEIVVSPRVVGHAIEDVES